MSASIFGDHDRAYYRDRAAAERNAAAGAACMVKDVHLELAELYEDRGRTGLPPARDGVQGKRA